MGAKIDPRERAYPKSFHPDALWNKDEIEGYLSITDNIFYEREMEIPTFKVGRPARRWDSVVTALISAGVGGVIGYAISQIF